jgi:hypothetical protein
MCRNWSGRQTDYARPHDRGPDRLLSHSGPVVTTGIARKSRKIILEHVAKKWIPVLRTRTCVTNKLEHAF